MTDESKPQLGVPKGVLICNYIVPFGSTAYVYDSVRGKILAIELTANINWATEYVRSSFAKTPQEAAQLGMGRARTENGRRKAKNALAAFREKQNG